jgi:hypothetical protein
MQFQLQALMIIMRQNNNRKVAHLLILPRSKWVRLESRSSSVKIVPASRLAPVIRDVYQGMMFDDRIRKSQE